MNCVNPITECFLTEFKLYVLDVFGNLYYDRIGFDNWKSVDLQIQIIKISYDFKINHDGNFISDCFYVLFSNNTQYKINNAVTFPTFQFFQKLPNIEIVIVKYSNYSYYTQ